MPALVLFGRRWLVAGDDLPAPALLLAIFHLVWTVVLSVWLGNAEVTCHDGTYYQAAMALLLGTCVLCMISEVLVAFESSKGSLFETKKRANLPLMVLVNLGLLGFQLGANIFATVVMYHASKLCISAKISFHLIRSYEAAVWSIWAVIGGTLMALLMTYNFFPDFEDPKEWEKHFVYLSTWCCCVGGSNKEVIKTFRRMGELFYLVIGHLDLTFSDLLIMGYLTLWKQRFYRMVEEAEEYPEHSDIELGSMNPSKSQPRIEENEIETLKECSLRRTNSVPVILRRLESGIEDVGCKNMTSISSEGIVSPPDLTEVAHYMKFAFAAYGWMLYVWAHPGKGIVDLCCGRTCGLWSSMLRIQDGVPLNLVKAPYLNREAILQASRLKEKDLIFVRHEGQIKDVLPYYIALDHDTEKIIIAIRGSMSFDDVVRDLQFEPVDIDAWLFHSQPWDAPPVQAMDPTINTKSAAHKGIFEASRAVIEDIKKEGKLFNLARGEYEHYPIVVCGHSLGAGSAFLVALHLRSYFPDLRCIAFSPPGALISRDIAEASRDWCISTVCGKEVIPRLTLSNVEKLRDDMVQLAIFCRMPKIQIILNWVMNRIVSEPDVYYSHHNLPEEPQRWLHLYRENLQKRSEIRKIIEHAEDFSPPGRILYMKPTGKEKHVKRLFCSRTKHAREYECVWVKGGDQVLERGILLSGRMMKDHMPDYSYALLKKLAKSVRMRRGTTVLVDDRAGERYTIYSAEQASGDSWSTRG